MAQTHQMQASKGGYLHQAQQVVTACNVAFSLASTSDISAPALARCMSVMDSEDDNEH